MRFPGGGTLGAVLAATLLVGCARRASMWSPFPSRTSRTSGAPADYTEAAFGRKTIPTYRVKVGPDGKPVETVIGKTQEYRIRQKDTLLDVARLYDLGYNEIVAANPGVDPWVPKVGSTIVIPTAWVLPCCTYEGIVLNIPEMRLFLYRRDPGGLTVVTYPVGLGRDDRRTPRGRFRVTTRTVNPTWIIPESIRREHIRERGDARRVIAGGAPDNPLGKYRLKLDSAAPYGIHGTDIPWGVGMQVSHGCVRLYPEDIERLYPLVPTGTPVEFTYQTVKVGKRDGTTWVELSDDIYRQGPRTPDAKLVTLRQRVGDAEVDDRLVTSAMQNPRGYPVQVSRRRWRPWAFTASP